MTDILFAVSPSVFSWSMLGCGSSSAAFLLPRPEKLYYREGHVKAPVILLTWCVVMVTLALDNSGATFSLAMLQALRRICNKN